MKRGDDMGDKSGRNSDQGAHVVVVAYPAQGHINPVLRFARMLKAAAESALDVRLSVSVVTAEHALRRIQKVDHVRESGMHAFADGVPPEFDDWADIDYVRHSMCQHGPPSLRALLLQQLRPRVTFIVYDTFLEWVAPLAQQLHLPCAALWTQSCAVLYAYSQALAHPDSDSQALAAAALSGPLQSTELGVPDLPSFLQPAERGGYYERWFLEQVAALAAAAQAQTQTQTLRWVLGSSFTELEPQHSRLLAEVMPVPFATVGPLMPCGEEDEDEDEAEAAAQMWPTASAECAAWLGRQRRGSVVYVSFGSMTAVGEEQARQVTRALRESEVPFLWSARAASTAEAEALAEAAESGLGIVVPWAPQAAILRHPAVGALVSHCGWNSTLEAVAAGVPMVCVPQFADQPTNAAFVSRVWRNGVVVSRQPPHEEQGLVVPGGRGRGRGRGRLLGPPGVVPAQEFVRCLRMVLGGHGDGECIRRNAANVQAAANAAVTPPVGSSWSNLVGFVSQVASLSTSVSPSA